MNARLDMEKIAKGLRAERRGKVTAGGGWFGAAQLAARLLERAAQHLGENEAERPADARRAHR